MRIPQRALWGHARGQFPTEEVGRAPPGARRSTGDLVRLAEPARGARPIFVQRAPPATCPPKRKWSGWSSRCGGPVQHPVRGRHCRTPSVDRTIFEKDAQVLPVRRNTAGAARGAAPRLRNSRSSAPNCTGSDGLFTRNTMSCLPYRGKRSEGARPLCPGHAFVVLTKRRSTQPGPPWLPPKPARLRKGRCPGRARRLADRRAGSWPVSGLRSEITARPARGRQPELPLVRRN